MTGASKILTVSYGTFSCTLEGFDDPFNTMRAIAEYFRDLAAEDRYFGAEPPTPDAAMLHRIAEREVQRRVDAKVQDNSIHLRASAGPDSAPERTARPAQAIVPTVNAQAAPASVSEPAPAVVQPATGTPAPQTPAAQTPTAETAAPETIAERLLRLRSEVAAQQTVPVPQAITPATVALTLADYSEDIADTAATASASLAETFTTEDFTADDFTAEDFLPEDDIAADTDTDTETGQLPESFPESRVAPDSADLPEAVVAAHAGPLHQPEPEADAAIAATLASVLIQTAPQAPASVPPRAEPAPVPADTNLLADIDASFGGVAAAADDDDTTDNDGDATDDFDDDSGIDSLFGDTDDTVPPAETPLQENESAVSAEKLQRARARIYRIRSVDQPADAPAGQPAAALSAQAEQDLARELAALRDDAAPPRTAAHPFGDPSAEDAVSRLMAQADTEMEGEETKRRQSAIAHLKAAVAQTVAERRAGETKPDPEPSRIARYRNDLAMVVRSALPGVMQPKASGERPAPLVLVSEQRIDRQPTMAGGPIPAAPPLAPPAPQHPSQIRPRRVTGSGSGLAMQAHSFPDHDDDLDDLDLHLTEVLAEADEDLAASVTQTAAETAQAEQDFRDYARRIGAASLREILEAAASFLTVVLGRPEFTRPQLMRLVAQIIPQTDQLREDSLRVFGTLLRDGHLAKVRRGIFSLTAASPYHPKAT